MKAIAHLILTAAMTWVVAATAAGQSWTPVDQAVADLDPLATSLRHLEPGLNVFGQQSSLFLAPSDNVLGPINTPTYYRIGPGFRARVDRIDYLSLTADSVSNRLRPEDFSLNASPRVDGAFIESFGPNTVFDLTTPNLTSQSFQPTADSLPDYRIDGRINTRIDARLADSPTQALPGNLINPATHRVLVPHQPIPDEVLETIEQTFQDETDVPTELTDEP